ncbi:MAG: hypothetical protein ABSF71_06435 [Terriglobia bacterium]|jgi:hypothetical protein
MEANNREHKPKCSEQALAAKRKNLGNLNTKRIYTTADYRSDYARQST